MVYKLTINDSTSLDVKKLRKETTKHDQWFERELEVMEDWMSFFMVQIYIVLTFEVEFNFKSQIDYVDCHVLAMSWWLDI